MTISDLGSIGEFVSSLAVVASLIYLAIQIRQNTRSVQASAIQDVNTDSQKLLLSLTDPEVAKVMLKVESNQPLGTEEAYIGGYWLAAATRGWENQYYQYQHGLIGEEIYRSRQNALLDKVVRTEFGRKWWGSLGRKIYSKSFAATVDALIRKEVDR